MYRIILSIFLFTLFFSSCNDKSNNSQDTTKEDKAEKVIKKELTSEEKKELKDKANSVMARTMVTQDVSSFSRTLVTLELTDMLSKVNAEYTLLAPRNEAFEVLGKGQNIVNDPEKREELRTLIQGHIIKGNFDSATLVQEIRKNSKLETTDLNGNKLTFNLKGDDITVTNASGSTAIVGKSDIKGTNGVLHIINAILQ